MSTIQWGIIGCGDVCEVKSGPAFSKIAGSKLVAVMRRDLELAKDFARRHHVPRFYDDAAALISDPDVNAVYVATPPSSHEMYTEMALRAGKPVYVEKPVTTSAASCERMIALEKKFSGKVSVAHYRRGLPLYREVKRLVTEGAIGKVNIVRIEVMKPPPPVIDERLWRVNPALSGGGFFHDLSPHQLDILYWIFGEPVDVSGRSGNLSNQYDAPDTVMLQGEFSSGAMMQGLWAFNIHENLASEKCEIIGEKGKLTFSFFRNSELLITSDAGTERIDMEYPTNIQMPMIGAVTNYFRGDGSNPCSLEEALVVMKMMEAGG